MNCEDMIKIANNIVEFMEDVKYRIKELKLPHGEETELKQEIILRNDIIGIFNGISDIQDHYLDLYRWLIDEEDDLKETIMNESDKYC